MGAIQYAGVGFNLENGPLNSVILLMFGLQCVLIDQPLVDGLCHSFGATFDCVGVCRKMIWLGTKLVHTNCSMKCPGV